MVGNRGGLSCAFLYYLLIRMFHGLWYEDEMIVLIAAHIFSSFGLLLGNSIHSFSLMKALGKIETVNLNFSKELKHFLSLISKMN